MNLDSIDKLQGKKERPDIDSISDFWSKTIKQQWEMNSRGTLNKKKLEKILFLANSINKN